MRTTGVGAAWSRVPADAICRSSGGSPRSSCNSGKMPRKPLRHFMRPLRHLTVLLLIFTLPIYGWAALGLWQNCPMQSMSVEALADSGHDCCDPAADRSDGDQGQPHGCKPGQECKTGSLYDPRIPRLGDVLVAADGVNAAPPDVVLSRDPAGLWRPPRTL